MLYNNLMSNHIFRKVAGGVFTAVAVVHALRLLFDWEVLIGSWFMPVWLSWVALPLIGWLAYSGLKK